MVFCTACGRDGIGIRARLRALWAQARVGSSPTGRTGGKRAVSSVVERLVYTERAGGSSPPPPTRIELNDSMRTLAQLKRLEYNLMLIVYVVD